VDSRSDMAAPVALVTGANGFTGRYVAVELERAGYDVVQMQARGDPAAVAVDLSNRVAVRDAVERLQPRVVIHLAAISFVAHEDVDELYRVNIVGTRNLLEALARLENPPRHVLLASSANIYGNASGDLDEQVAPAPANDYAVSKFAMELMSRQFQDVLPMTLVRPFNYTGLGQSERFLIPKIVGHFQRREARLELGNLDISRDFNDVRNIAAVYTGLVDLPGRGVVYNVSSGVEHTLLDVVEMMRQISGHSMEVVVNPAFVRDNEVKRLRGDSSRIRAALPALPQIGLRQTLQWMYDSP